MNRTHPHCDRHPNLQMVPCRLKRNKTVVSGHICPVPGCGRCHVDQGYVRLGDVELLAGPDLLVPAKKVPAKSISAARPLNRHAAARAAILRAIEQNRS